MSTSGLPDGFDDLESAMRTFEREQEKLVEFQRKLAETKTIVDAPKKLFTVTLDGSGELTDLKFNTTGYRTMPPAELSAMLLETLRKARLQSMRTMEELRGEPLIPGIGAEELATGDVDMASVLDKIMGPSLELLRDANAGPLGAPSKRIGEQTPDDGWERTR